ncbi:MAG: ATPase synthesis protein 25 mitochondrial [Caeruleum heppii]|nr:MAG: ATPase synthesis protein 25 mitochondrial [Caeruleum heppii]
MAVNRVLTSSVRCFSCRTAILTSLTGFSTVASRPQPPSNTFRPSRVSSRPISSSRPSPSSSVEPEPSGPVIPEGQSHPPDVVDVPDTSRTEPSEVQPWYLRVDSRPQVPAPFLERQQLPALPADAPLLLQPLLQHLSVELGLDYLSVLDLRSLDPPPALGSSLLMILGTARSEKHLHVSADRLCRWLRTEHDMSPYADGLLGRNELKLKIKRKARRRKLLSSVGASQSEGPDDGMRTGWVCVNLGSVSHGEKQETSRDAQEGIIGFGGEGGGVQIVVQMLTEAKREDLDLEGLWGGLLKRKEKRGAKEQDALDEIAEDDNTIDTVLPYTGPLSAYRPPHFPPSKTGSGINQTRSYHTSIPRSFADVSTQPLPSQHAETLFNVEDSPQPPSARTIDSSQSHNDHILWSTVQQGDYQAVRRMLLPHPTISPSASRAIVLQTCLIHLRSLPTSSATKLLGRGHGDIHSTPFLHYFHSLIPPFAEPAHWAARIDLHIHALKVGHPGYTKPQLQELLSTTHLAGMDLPLPTHHAAIRALIARHHLANPGLLPEHAHPASYFSRADLQTGLHLLEQLSRRHGYPDREIWTQDTLLALHEAVAFLQPVRNPHARSSEPALADPHAQHPHLRRGDYERTITAQRRLSALADHLAISITSEPHLLRLLTLHAHAANWPAFWDTFAHPARLMRARSPALYAFVYHTAARTEHQKFCIETLRRCVDMMGRERPRVELTGEVARGVMRCLEWADEGVQERAGRRPVVRGEWVGLWRACEVGLKEG